MSILMDLILIIRRSARRNRMKGATLNSDIKTNFVMNCFYLDCEGGGAPVGVGYQHSGYGNGYPS